MVREAPRLAESNLRMAHATSIGTCPHLRAMWYQLGSKQKAKIVPSVAPADEAKTIDEERCNGVVLEDRLALRGAVSDVIDDTLEDSP